MAGVGTNRYAYSFNDPVNKIDPNGNRAVGPEEAEEAEQDRIEKEEEDAQAKKQGVEIVVQRAPPGGVVIRNGQIVPRWKAAGPEYATKGGNGLVRVGPGKPSATANPKGAPSTQSTKARAGTGVFQGKYVSNPKHGRTQRGGNRGVISSEPTRGEVMLGRSVPSGTSGKVRVAYDSKNREFVTFRSDNAGGWHGYVERSIGKGGASFDRFFDAGIISGKGVVIK